MSPHRTTTDIARNVRDWLNASSDDERAATIDWQGRGEALERALHALLDAVDASTGSDGVARFDAREALTRTELATKILWPKA